RTWDESNIDRSGNVIRLHMLLWHYHVTSPSSRLSVAGPIPETASRSLSCVKAPCWSRWASIFSAVAGPTPGSVSRAVASAVLRLTVVSEPAILGPPAPAGGGGFPAVA